MVSDLAISPQKYPKIGTQEKKNVKESAKLFFKTMLLFLRSFDVVFHMFKYINQTFHQNKKCSWEKKLENKMWC